MWRKLVGIVAKTWSTPFDYIRAGRGGRPYGFAGMVFSPLWGEDRGCAGRWEEIQMQRDSKYCIRNTFRIISLEQIAARQSFASGPVILRHEIGCARMRRVCSAPLLNGFPRFID
jgi:hypothetical protein